MSQQTAKHKVFPNPALLLCIFVSYRMGIPFDAFATNHEELAEVPGDVESVAGSGLEPREKRVRVLSVDVNLLAAVLIRRKGNNVTTRDTSRIRPPEETHC